MGNLGHQADQARSYWEIEGIAKRVRAKMLPHIGPSVAVPTNDLLCGIGSLVGTHEGKRVPVVYGVDELDMGVEAETWFNEELHRIEIDLSVCTYEQLEFDDGRARFSLCHELGHVILHFRQVIRLAGTHRRAAAMMRGTARHSKCWDTEWQANAFAGALLMPAEGLAMLEQAEGLSTQAIAHAFGVSGYAADVRDSIYRKRKTELLAA
jgi:hypothetical protein